MRTDEGGRRENAVSIVTGGEVDRGVLVEVGEQKIAGNKKFLKPVPSDSSDRAHHFASVPVSKSFTCGSVS